jgi:hypothetical protein
MVASGVLHDALQGVDAAQSDVQGLRSQIADCGVEPAGDLSVLRDA